MSPYGIHAGLRDSLAIAAYDDIQRAMSRSKEAGDWEEERWLKIMGYEEPEIPLQLELQLFSNRPIDAWTRRSA